MKKMFCLMALCCVLMAGCGCENEAHIERHYGIKGISDRMLCFNGHLYLDYDRGAIPLFDYRTNTPTLISCPQEHYEGLKLH